MAVEGGMGWQGGNASQLIELGLRPGIDSGGDLHHVDASGSSMAGLMSRRLTLRIKPWI